MARLARAGRGFRSAKVADDLGSIDDRYGDDRAVWMIALDGATLFDLPWSAFRVALLAALDRGMTLTEAEVWAYGQFDAN